MRAKPIARSEGLLAEQVGAETVVYDTDTAEAHCLKPLAASVFAYCDGKRSVAQISKLVSKDLGQDVDAEAIAEALEQLHAHKLLQGDDEMTVSRRQMLRRTAGVGGAAMAVPLIASIVTPIPAFAVNSCTASTNTTAVGCNQATDCSGGHTFSGVGTCGCKTFPSPCPQPPSGKSGICFFHEPDSSGGHCSPSCADGTPPCQS
jgi:hypothetical protein